MGKVDISVIMSIYDEKDLDLKLAIESVLKQSFKNFEFIIILDNPENIKLEKVILKYIKNDKRIVFIKNKKNLALAGSLNRGIKVAKGKYIARMDADDISEFSRLKTQFEFMEANTDVDLLFSWIKQIDLNNNFIKNFNPNREKVKNIRKYFFKEHLLVHPTLFCKKKILIKNQFDSNFKRSQDFELWIRLIKLNYKFDLIEKELLKYRVPQNQAIEQRIKKIKGFNYWTLKALNKNLSLIEKLSIIFYLKNIFLSVLLRFPESFLKKVIIIKDRLRYK